MTSAHHMISLEDVQSVCLELQRSKGLCVLYNGIKQIVVQSKLKLFKSLHYR